MRTRFLLGHVALAAISCSPAVVSRPPQSQSQREPPMATAALRTGPGATPTRSEGTTSPVALAASPRSRRPADPMEQDMARRAAVDAIMRTIAGRENQPAGKVFKNVTVLKNTAAGDLLKAMDEQYGRGLGMTCNRCHVTDKFEDDSKKNKRVARQMQEMTDRINDQQLANVNELDKDYAKASCVMCHRGDAHAEGTMTAAASPLRRAP